MWVNFVPSGISVFNAVNDAIILYWHLLHSSLSRGNSFMVLYTGWEKKTINKVQFNSFLLGMLLAPLVVRYIAIRGLSGMLYNAV